MHHRTDNDPAFRTLNIIDEYSRECLAIRVTRKLNSTDAIDALTDLFIVRGVRGYVRSDNGPEFIAEAVRKWISTVGARTAYIEPGSPWTTQWGLITDTIRSDKGPEYIGHKLAEWSETHKIKMLFIQPGNPQQNAYVERYN